MILDTDLFLDRCATETDYINEDKMQYEMGRKYKTRKMERMDSNPRAIELLLLLLLLLFWLLRDFTPVRILFLKLDSFSFFFFLYHLSFLLVLIPSSRRSTISFFLPLRCVQLHRQRTKAITEWMVGHKRFVLFFLIFFLESISRRTPQHEKDRMILYFIAK